MQDFMRSDGYPSMTSQFVVVGHITHDRCDETVTIGGSAYFGAAICHRLGNDAQVVTSVASDFRFFDEIQALEPRVLPSPQTTTFANFYMPNGARSQRVFGRALQVLPDLLKDCGRSVDVLHLVPVLGEVELESWKSGCRYRILAIGLQGWLRTTEGDGKDPRGSLVVPLAWRPRPGELSGVDVAFVSDEDLGGDDSLLPEICREIPVVIRTSGADGAQIITHGECWRIGVYPTQAVDPTGAGDAFAAGFLHAYASGQNLEAAGRFGAAVASLVIEGLGGQSIDRVAEASSRMQRIKSSRVVSPV